MSSGRLPKVASTPSLGLQVEPQLPQSGTASASGGLSRHGLQRSHSGIPKVEGVPSRGLQRSQSGIPSFRSSSGFRDTSQTTFGQIRTRLPPLPQQPLTFEDFYSTAKHRAQKKSIELAKIQPKRKRCMPMIHHRNLKDSRCGTGGRNPTLNVVRLPEAVERRNTPQDDGQQSWDPLRNLVAREKRRSLLSLSEKVELLNPVPQEDVPVTGEPRRSMVQVFNQVASASRRRSSLRQVLDQQRAVRKSTMKKRSTKGSTRFSRKESDVRSMMMPSVREETRERRGEAEEQIRLKRAYQRYAPGQEEVHVEQFPEVLDYLGFLLLEPEIVKEAIEKTTKFATLSFNEFSDVVEKCREREMQALRHKFETVDIDSDGMLSAEEVKTLMESCGVTPLRATVLEAYEAVDCDQSGFLDFDEFEHLMAVYRVTEGFTQAEVQALQRVFDRFSTMATHSLAGKILRAGHLGGALKHMFGPQATEFCHIIANRAAQVLRGGDVRDASGVDQDTAQAPVSPSTSKVMNVSTEGYVFSEFLVWARRLREMELADLRIQFDKFDVDRSGGIDLDELQDLIKSFGFMPLQAVVADALLEVDLDGNNILDFDEFLELLVHFRNSDGFSRKEVDEFSTVFSVYDKDNEGEISCLELVDMLRYLGHITTFNSLQRVVREVDFNNTNTIDFREFLRIMRLEREKELTVLQKSFNQHKNDSGLLPASKVQRVLSSGGYMLTEEEVRSIIEAAGDQADFDFDECVEIVDQARKACVVPRRKVAGYSDEQIKFFSRAFEVYDEDRNGTIERRELEKLLRDLKIELRTVDDQKELLAKIDAARSTAQKAGVSPDLIGAMGQPFITFHTLLHFLRQLHNEDDRNQVFDEATVVEECNFTAHEVVEFRQIFFDMASASGGEKAATSVKPTTREASLIGRSMDKAFEVGPITEYLSDQSVFLVVSSLGVKMDQAQRDEMNAKLQSFHSGGRQGLVFADFLRFMRWMLDTNFANINGVEAK